MGRIVCFGEMLLRLSSPQGERLFQSGALHTHFVGAEANVAASLANFGDEAAFVSVLPEGPVGRACIKALQQEGVDCRDIVRAAGRMAIYFFEPGAMMRPSVIHYDRKGSAFAELSPGVFDWARILKGAEWLHVCGITLAVGKGPAAAAGEAMDAARRLGVKVSFDCNYRASLWAGREEEAAAVMKDMAARADHIFAGDKDARYLCGLDITEGEPAERFARARNALFEAFPNLKSMAATHREVVSTDINVLCAFYSDGATIYESAPRRLENIIDRIGGGDAFAAGVLHQKAKKADGQALIDFALAAAALKHAVRGDFNLSTEQEVNALAEGGGGDVVR